MQVETGLTLFGQEDRPWDVNQWTRIDDSNARGGNSRSRVHVVKPKDGGCSRLVFEGELDIKKLGGAGFAAQQTVDSLPPFDLAGYDTLVLAMSEPFDKTFTLVLKDGYAYGDIKSTIGWEHSFSATDLQHASTAGGQRIDLRLDDFKAFYRGRPVDDAPALDRGSIKRIQLMCRSNFGQQEGKFRLVLSSIVAVNGPEDTAKSASARSSQESHPKLHLTEARDHNAARRRGWLGSLLDKLSCGCFR